MQAAFSMSTARTGTGGGSTVALLSLESPNKFLCKAAQNNGCWAVNSP